MTWTDRETHSYVLFLFVLELDDALLNRPLALLWGKVGKVLANGVLLASGGVEEFRLEHALLVDLLHREWTHLPLERKRRVDS